MSSQLKPIKLYGEEGVNPPKVKIILQELGLPFETVAISMGESKGPEYTAINPNGRVPAIYDPNNDLTLWESIAIVEYLIDKYDTEHRISFAPGTKEYYLARQWVLFQVSGQGPYYGQAVWFTHFHSEKIPSAIERYRQEVLRVTGVLESWLAKQAVGSGSDGPWLVGDKMTYADMCFVPWQEGIKFRCPDIYEGQSFPFVEAWVAKMVACNPPFTAADAKEAEEKVEKYFK
jgi:glutathione S-transferase